MEPADAIVTELDPNQRRISLARRPSATLGRPAASLPGRSIIGVKGAQSHRVRCLHREITEEIVDGLVCVSDMSWTKRIKHPAKSEDIVRARITNIDADSQRVSLSIKEFLPNEWQEFVENNRVGDVVTGRVVNVTDFGLFIDIFDGLEGLAHISEIDFPGGKLEGQFEVGKWVRARILRIEQDDKKVGLTLRGVTQPTDEEIVELEAAATPVTPPVESEESEDEPA
ncbi:MAG: S1 RNA-binding domain-containing protein [Thermoanaerobaculia bacterium]